MTAFSCSEMMETMYHHNNATTMTRIPLQVVSPPTSSPSFAAEYYGSQQPSGASDVSISPIVSGDDRLDSEADKNDQVGGQMTTPSSGCDIIYQNTESSVATPTPPESSSDFLQGSENESGSNYDNAVSGEHQHLSDMMCRMNTATQEAISEEFKHRKDFGMEDESIKNNEEFEKIIIPAEPFYQTFPDSANVPTQYSYPMGQIANPNGSQAYNTQAFSSYPPEDFGFVSRSIQNNTGSEDQITSHDNTSDRVQYMTNTVAKIEDNYNAYQVVDARDHCAVATDRSSIQLPPLQLPQVEKVIKYFRNS